VTGGVMPGGVVTDGVVKNRYTCVLGSMGRGKGKEPVLRLRLKQAGWRKRLEVAWCRQECRQ